MTVERDIDIRLLLVFDKIVKHESFSGAQVELNVTQSAISTQMNTLESRLGMRLCQRGRAGFKLTEDGKGVHAAARKLLDSVASFHNEIDQLREKLGGTLRIGILDNTITNTSVPLHKVFRRFNQREHSVQIELSIGNPTELEVGVIEGRLHLAIGDFPRKIETLQFKPIYSESHSLYCGTLHPLFQLDDAMAVDALIKTSNVVGLSYTNGMDLRMVGVENSDVAVTNVECMMFMILTGQYLGFLPNHYAEYWVRTGQLKPIQPRRFYYDSVFHVITRKGAPDNLATETFLMDLEEILPPFVPTL
ncbi:MAG: LysR family transcriptional regulator [Alphaproteobacteria bacterium]